jgi:hypothetical protein
MDRRADDGSGDGVAGDDLGLVLDIADKPTDAGSSVLQKGHADDEKKGKGAKRAERHGGFREPSIGGGQS